MFEIADEAYAVENAVEELKAVATGIILGNNSDGVATWLKEYYACSPEESSFKAIFTDMKLTECMWKAHDGQQPDEIVN